MQDANQNGNGVKAFRADNRSDRRGESHGSLAENRIDGLAALGPAP